MRRASNNSAARADSIIAFQVGRDRFDAVRFPLRAVRGSRRYADQYRAAQPRCFSAALSAGVLEIGNVGWTDVSAALEPKGRLTVRIDDYRPFDALFTIYAASDRPLAPALIGISGTGTPHLTVDTFDRRDPAARSRLSAATAVDRLTLPEDLTRAPVVSRAEVRVNDHGDFSLFGLRPGRRHQRRDGSRHRGPEQPEARLRVLASLEPGERVAGAGDQGDDSPRVERCAVQWRLVSGRTTPGWPGLPLDGRPCGPRHRDRNAPRYARQGHRRAARLSGRRGGRLTLAINGVRLESRPLPSGRAAISWTVPEELWRDSLNELAFDVDGARRPSKDVGAATDKRMLGVSVTAIELSALTARGR